jgi:methyl-accepting chemotaxis protein
LVLFLNSSALRTEITEKELAGLALLKRVLPLQENFAKHRGLMAGYLNGATEFESRIVKIENNLKQMLQDIEANTPTEQAEFLDKALFQEIKTHWLTLTGKRNLSPGESFQSHTELIQSQLILTEHIANQSHLSLDPDITTSELIILPTQALPQLFEALGKARGKASGIVSNGQLTPANQILINTFYSEIIRLKTVSQIRLDNAYGDSTSASSTIIAAWKKAVEKIRDFTNMLEKDVITASSIQTSPKVIFAAGSQAIAASQDVMAEVFPEIQSLLEERKKAIATERNNQLLIAAAFFLSALITAWLIMKGINQQLKSVVKTISNATKDKNLSLRAKVTSGDEIGEIATHLNQMLGSFQKLIGEINNTSQQLTFSAEQAQETSEQSSIGLSIQQQETEQLATAIHEMASTAQEVANNTVNAAEAAASVDAQSNQGNSLVGKAVTAIHELHDEVNQVGHIIAKLNNSSNAITTVLDVIKNVAEQTNLLALNAAIEAARAGEQGRGFAVVADEVRGLAQRTQDSAGEIEGLILSFQRDAGDANDVLQNSQQKVQETVEKTQDVERALVSINIAIATIRDMNHQIAAATEETVAVNSEINQNISKIDAMSQQSVTGAKEISDASKRQASLVKDLKQLAGEFIV